MSVAETQRLTELLHAIHELTGMRAIVCDRGGTMLAACPDASEDAQVMQVCVPLHSGTAEIGSILLEASVMPEEGRMAGAAKLIDVMASYIDFYSLLYPEQKTLRQTILDYITNNLSADLSVQTLCYRFSVSKSELYRLLRKQAPNGIAAYVREKRFRKACELLRGTGKPLWQVAAEVGYDNPDYFLRAFKQNIGISAGRYRKEAQ